jgi:hypothetical protein
MLVEEGCAMEHRLDPNKRQADWPSYAAKYTNGTMIFTYVELYKQNSAPVHKWIKFLIGEANPYPTPQYEEVEWTYFVKGELVRDGWRRFDISLVKATEETWGRYGWSYLGLLRIRLRSELWISPIEFLESERSPH